MYMFAFIKAENLEKYIFINKDIFRNFKCVIQNALKLEFWKEITRKLDTIVVFIVISD